MRNFLRGLRNFLLTGLRDAHSYYSFLMDYFTFRKMAKNDNRFAISWVTRHPQLLDKTDETLFDPHYIYHPAWAARILARTKPSRHVDISSTLGFSTIISAFMPVEFYDYRPANIRLDNFHAGKADLLSLPFPDNSIQSLSCMHTIEHIGLGRYGDPIDPLGDIKAIKEIKRVLAQNGNFFFAVPIGKPLICFNAHRIYPYEQVMSYFDGFELKEFSLIPDNGRQIGIIKNASREQADNQKYGCGLFWFIKK